MAADRSPLTLVDDGRLDRDALDAAAAAAVAGLLVDLAGAERLVTRRRRDRIRRRLALVAVAAAVILLSFTLTPMATLVPPRPASVPTGPAALPRTVEVAPAWVPTADQDPIGRAVYLLGRDRFTDTLGGDRAFEPVLLSDGGDYRRLPVLNPDALALSRDGRRVAWAEKDQTETRVRVLDLRTGRIDTQALVGDFGRGVAVTSLAFSPDGSRLALGGTEPFGGGSGRPGIFLLDGGRLVEHCAGCGVLTDGVAWAPDGRLLVPAGAKAPQGAGTLPPGDGSGLFSGLELPVEGFLGQPVLSADGAARLVLGQVEVTGADRYRISLTRNVSGQSAGPTDLGEVRRAAVLADTRRGVLVSRVTRSGGDLVAVRPDGSVQTLTGTRPGAVVLAVAQDLVADARVVDGAAPPRWWSSAAWYRGQAARAGDRLGGVWWLAAAGLLVMVLMVPGARRAAGRVLGPARTAYGRVSASTPAVVAITLLGAGGVVSGMGLLPKEAAPAPATGGARSPVLPAVLQPQHLLPPRAYDESGQPRTRRISLMFGATFDGETRLVGVDADTGTLVRLDDLPGLPPRSDPTMFATSGGQSGGISPNGRFVAMGEVVVDLASATSRRVAEAGDATGGAAVTDDGTLLAVVPGTKDRITIARPGERGRTLDGSEGTVALEPHADGYVLTRFAGGTDGAAPTVDVIDPVGRRYLGRLAEVGQQVPAALVGGEPGGAAPTVVTVDSAAGTVRVGDRTVRAPGSVERLGGGVDGALAALGYGGPGTPYAVLRAEPGEGELRPLTRLEWPGVEVQGTALAAGVVSQARVVDVAPPRWDSWFAWRGELAFAGFALLVVVLFLWLDRLPVRVVPVEQAAADPA